MSLSPFLSHCFNGIFNPPCPPRCTERKENYLEIKGNRVHGKPRDQSESRSSRASRCWGSSRSSRALLSWGSSRSGLQLLLFVRDTRRNIISRIHRGPLVLRWPGGTSDARGRVPGSSGLRLEGNMFPLAYNWRPPRVRISSLIAFFPLVTSPVASRPSFEGETLQSVLTRPYRNFPPKGFSF